MIVLNFIFWMFMSAAIFTKVYLWIEGRELTRHGRMAEWLLTHLAMATLGFMVMMAWARR